MFATLANDTHIRNYDASEIMIPIKAVHFNFVFVAFPRKPGRPRDYAHLNCTKEGFDSDL